MSDKPITVKGLQKEQKDLRVSFDEALEVLAKATTVHKKAKDALVDFNNSYGRVLEVLDQPEQE